MIRKLLALTSIVALVTVGTLALTSPAGATIPSGDSSQLYVLTNQTRSANGLGWLGWDQNLAATAQDYANWMAATGTFAHDVSLQAHAGAAVPSMTAWGENIAYTTSTVDPMGQMQSMYMSSAGHRANILGTQYDRVGIGVARGGNRIYSVVRFARSADRSALGQPVGNLDTAASTGINQVHVAGWAIDPDTTAAIDVHVYADSQFLGALTADKPRADIGGAYPGFGSNHGYEASLVAPSGTHQICTYAINTASGTSNALLSCSTVTIGATPIGNLDTTTTAPGTVTLTGWTIDPDTTAAIDVHVYAEGQFLGVLTANKPRPDIGAAYPAYGPNHGYQAALAAPTGTHKICAYAINTGPGTTNPALACRTLTIGGNPTGNLDTATTGPGNVTLAGWTIDPDTTAPIDVHILADGQFLGAVTANKPRPDVGSAYPVYGPNHGYQTTLTAPAGTHQICAYAINTGAGTTNPLIACRTLTIGGNPIGNLDTVTTAPGTVTVAGWTIDPDIAAPIDVHILADGRFLGVLTANKPRADVGSAYPAYGPNHGYQATIAAPTGTHKICAYAINSGAGTTNPLLACSTLTIP